MTAILTHLSPFAIPFAALVAAEVRWNKFGLPHLFPSVFRPSTQSAACKLSAERIAVLDSSIQEDLSRINEQTKVVLVTTRVRSLEEVRALGQSLKETGVEEIFVETIVPTTIQPQIEKVTEALFDSVAQAPQLKRLSLSVTATGVDMQATATQGAIQQLERATQLTHLCLQDFDLGESAGYLGERVCGVRSRIEHLSVPHCTFSTDAQRGEFLHKLSGASQLRGLDVGSSEVALDPGESKATIEGLVAIAKLPHLEELTLGTRGSDDLSYRAGPRVLRELVQRSQPLKLLVLAPAVHGIDALDYSTYEDLRSLRSAGTEVYGPTVGESMSLVTPLLGGTLTVLARAMGAYVPPMAPRHFPLRERLVSVIPDLWACYGRGATELGEAPVNLCCVRTRPLHRFFTSSVVHEQAAALVASEQVTGRVEGLDEEAAEECEEVTLGGAYPDYAAARAELEAIQRKTGPLKVTVTHIQVRVPNEHEQRWVPGELTIRDMEAKYSPWGEKTLSTESYIRDAAATRKLVDALKEPKRQKSLYRVILDGRFTDHASFDELLDAIEALPRLTEVRVDNLALGKEGNPAAEQATRERLAQLNARLAERRLETSGGYDTERTRALIRELTERGEAISYVQLGGAFYDHAALEDLLATIKELPQLLVFEKSQSLRLPRADVQWEEREAVNLAALKLAASPNVARFIYAGEAFREEANVLDRSVLQRASPLREYQVNQPHYMPLPLGSSMLDERRERIGLAHQ